MAIEQPMNAPMRRLLPHEALHLRGETLAFGRRQGLETGTHRIHEVLLAHGKTHGQGAEEGRTKGIAAVPAAGKRRIQVDQKASDDKVGHFR
jgi:hypothetical protein